MGTEDERDYDIRLTVIEMHHTTGCKVHPWIICVFVS